MSSKLSVAVHILTMLALKGECVVTSDLIAESVNTNPVVIRRLMGLLRCAGLVDSKAGAGGGWVLRADPAAITLRDILHAVEPQTELFAMHRAGPNPRCPVGHEMECVLADVYAGIARGMDELLARTSIADIVGAIRARIAT